ncbi:MAG: ABC transporter ATP-binding protein [Oscillochloris sp.]|nr:ABC transporter ATP-binding protein [Oscillochloris sp.]
MFSTTSPGYAGHPEPLDVDRAVCRGWVGSTRNLVRRHLGRGRFRYRTGARLRHNLLATLLRRPGALPSPVPVGEAISRYRNDVAEVTDFPLWLPHVGGSLLMFVIAVVLMAQISLAITLVIFIPIVASVWLARLAWGRMLRAYAASAAATDRVSGFLTELLGAVQALKVAGAEAAAVAYLRELNDQRRRAVVRERMLHEVMFSLTDNLIVFGIGVILLLSGQALSAGTLSIGDFALFVFLLWHTIETPTLIGTFIGDYQQQGASIARLRGLAPDAPVDAMISDQPVAPPLAAVAPGADPQAPLIELRGLSYQYAGSGRGISDITLSIPAGSLTVVTGRVGAGKTTLLRALLGLLPAHTGAICWQGQPVDRPDEFFRPPRSAYTAQVARLFSDPLRENILLGVEASPEALRHAIHTAVLEPDLETFPEGLETLIGPRGVRLSGGQTQRTAAARMLVRQPELLVCDDLSSALDVETEAQLWERIAGAAEHNRRPTIVAVSHRPALLRRADRIVLMHEGRIADIGRLDELLARNPEMRALYGEE